MRRYASALLLFVALVLPLPVSAGVTVTAWPTTFPPVDRATTGPVTAYECLLGLITNTGATGATVMTLPAAIKGMSCSFVLTVAQDMDINPSGSERVLVVTNANGDALSSDATIGSTLTLWSPADGQWLVVGSTGVWTDAN